MSQKIVSFDEFSKMDLRIGKITKAEAVPAQRTSSKCSSMLEAAKAGKL